MTSTLSPTLALAQRELVRFLRQRNRVIGAFATPIVFWLLIGMGMGRSFSAPGNSAMPDGAGYLEYFFPGTILMILLFTAIFSTISVIEDRREGFLQGVLVAPVGRSAIVGGKVLGGAILATGQAILFLILGWLTGIAVLTPLSFIVAVAVMFLIAVALTALGLCLAWRMTSTQGFHAIMNLFLMPMWFLSGALFPLRDDTPLLFKAVMLANPLGYALAWLRSVLWAPRVDVHHALIPWQVSMSVTIAFAGVMLVAALLIARTRTTADAT
jgi:ABC-2 type transport system permease protein